MEFHFYDIAEDPDMIFGFQELFTGVEALQKDELSKVSVKQLQEILKSKYDDLNKENSRVLQFSVEINKHTGLKGPKTIIFDYSPEEVMLYIQ